MFHKEGSSISSSTSGKKYKDVTLRKSDRKQLFQSVLYFFHIDTTTTTTTTHHGHDDVKPADDNNETTFHQPTEDTITNISDRTISTNTTSRPKPCIDDDDDAAIIAVSLLEDIFLRNGEIYERTISKWSVSSFVALNETCVVNVHQYYRSPYTSTLLSASSTTTTRSTSDTSTEHVVQGWPYSLYAQCVWIKIEILDSGATTSTSSGTTNLYHLPGLALLSVLPPTLYTPFFVTQVPSPLSEYICSNGVKHIMRVGLRSIPAYHHQHPQTMSLSQRHSIDRRMGMVTLVCVQGNPQPIGVGILHPDLIAGVEDTASSTLSTVPLFGPGCPKGGIGVSVVHAYGDDIWRQQLPTPKETDRIQQWLFQPTQQQQHSRATTSTYISNPWGQSLFDLGHYGNIGFINGQYVEPNTSNQSQHVDDAAPQYEQCDSAAVESNHNSAGNDVIHVMNTKELESIQLENADDKEDNDDAELDDTKALPELDENITCYDPVDQTLSPNDILHDAVCRALARIDSKKDLPMTMATFYAQFVLPNRKDGTMIQLKQTRYKKFSSYVKEQVENALLLVGKHVSSNNTTDPMGMLIGFDRKHIDLIPYIATQKEETAALAEAGILLGVQKRLEIADLYCVPNHFVALLKLDPNVVKAMNAKTEERRGTGMLTAKEVKSILDDYISEEGLIDSNHPDTVILNGPLTDALYKKKMKKSTVGNTDMNAASPTTPLSLQRKELVKLWMACQESAYALVQVPGNTILKLKRGQAPKITIEVTRRQSNKYVTTVIGLEQYGINLAEFAKDVANRFASASTIDTESTSASTDVVVVQGNLSIEIEALLLSDEKLTEHGGVKGSTYFLPKNSIHVVLKKGVPARKKNQSKK